MSSERNVQVENNLLYFIGHLLYFKHKKRVLEAVETVILTLTCIRDRYLTIHQLPREILDFQVKHLNREFQGDFLIVNGSAFKDHFNKYAYIRFWVGRKHVCKHFWVLYESKLPKNFILISNESIFNIRNTLRVVLSSQPINFKVLRSVDEPQFTDALSLSISFVNTLNHSSLPTKLLNDCLVNYFKIPRVLQKNDIFRISLPIYSPYFRVKNGSVCFRVIDYTLNTTDNTARETTGLCRVTGNTSIFEKTSASSFTPKSLPSSANGLSWALPGMWRHFDVLRRWFAPFLAHSVKDLRPVFFLSGPSGSGKTYLLESSSAYFGVDFVPIDCFDVVGNVRNQIVNNVQAVLKTAKSHCPCIVELSHSQVLNLNSDHVDRDLLSVILRDELSKYRSDYPIIFVFTADEVDALGGASQFVNLFLEKYQIDAPEDGERYKLVKWLGVKLELELDEDTVRFIANQTASFNLGDLEKLMRLSRSDVPALSRADISRALEKLNAPKVGNNAEWEDIGGVDKIKKEVLSSLAVSKLLPSAKRTGLLLYGPPGTGKTLLARTVASRCARNFISVKGPELLNMYIGQSEANIREVFNRAKDSSPCIMFFDELDSLAPNRGNKSDAGGVMDRVVSQLLAEMDSLEGTDVFILGATNRPDLIDQALLRPGRFDKTLYVGPCEDDSAKVNVIKALTRKFKMKDVDLEKLAKNTPGQVTGANLYSVCSLAWNLAAREMILNGETEEGRDVIVCQSHFEQAVEQTFQK